MRYCAPNTTPLVVKKIRFGSRVEGYHFVLSKIGVWSGTCFLYLSNKTPITPNERIPMSKHVKIGFFVFAIALLLAPAVAEAQFATRRGTVAGAIIGGIVGDQNNEALAGVAIGGIVGNVVGRTIDNRSSFGGGGGYYQQPAYRQPVYQQPVYRQPVYQQPVYRSYNSGYYRQPVYGYGGRGCGGY